MEHVNYFTASPVDELPACGKINILVPGPEVTSKTYISNMEHEQHYGGDSFFDPFVRTYKNTEWTEPEHGVVIEFRNAN